MRLRFLGSTGIYMNRNPGTGTGSEPSRALTDAFIPLGEMAIVVRDVRMALSFPALLVGFADLAAAEMSYE